MKHGHVRLSIKYTPLHMYSVYIRIHLKTEVSARRQKMEKHKHHSVSSWGDQVVAVREERRCWKRFRGLCHSMLGSQQPSAVSCLLSRSLSKILRLGDDAANPRKTKRLVCGRCTIGNTFLSRGARRHQHKNTQKQNFQPAKGRGRKSQSVCFEL